jgi:hypothetical protein
MVLKPLRVTIEDTLCLPAENIYWRGTLPVLRSRTNCVGGCAMQDVGEIKLDWMIFDIRIPCLRRSGYAQAGEFRIRQSLARAVRSKLHWAAFGRLQNS